MLLLEERDNMFSMEAKKIFIIFSLGIIMATTFAFLSVTPIYPADPIQYDRLGYNLAMGHGYSLSDRAPYVPTFYREPFYPVFLAATYLLFGHNVNAAVIIQIILHSLTAVLAYAIGKEIFYEKVAFVAGLAVAVFPTLASTTNYIMSETLITFLICLAIYLLIKAVRLKKIYIFIASGLVFGMMTLTKAVSLFLPLALAPVLLLVEARRRSGFRRLFILVLCFFLVYVSTVSVWSIRNKKVFGTFSIVVQRSGIIIWSRAEKVNYAPHMILAMACCNFSESLAKKYFPDIAAKPNRLLYRDLEKALDIENRYTQEGLLPTEIDNILKKEAYGKILRHPVKYLLYTFVEGIKMTAFTYLPFLSEESTKAYFERVAHGHLALSVLKGVMRLLAYPLLALSFFGMIRNLRLWDRWFIAFAVIAYFNLAYSLLDAIGRYAVPLIPLYCIFAAAAFYTSGETTS